MHRLGSDFVKQLPSYRHMVKLKKLYQTPHDLLYCPFLSLSRKKSLLEKWYNDRMRFVFENYRDHDYLLDREIEEINKTDEVIKAVLSAEKKISAEINIYWFYGLS